MFQNAQRKCTAVKTVRKSRSLNFRRVHAIRREEGRHFRVTKFTKICSRHFRTGDVRKTLGGKCDDKDGVVPSVFPWIRTSPQKRKELTARNFNVLAALSSAARNLNTSVVSAEEPASELLASVSDFESNSSSTLKTAKPKWNSLTMRFT